MLKGLLYLILCFLQVCRIAQILNAHTDSLQWIDQHTGMPKAQQIFCHKYITCPHKLSCSTRFSENQQMQFCERNKLTFQALKIICTQTKVID